MSISILGPDGKPVREPTAFITPDCMTREMLEALTTPPTLAVEMKIADLRESVSRFEYSCLVGYPRTAPMGCRILG